MRISQDNFGIGIRVVTVMVVSLIPLMDSDREQFIADNQEAFNYGAMEEFGIGAYRNGDIVVSIHMA